MKITFDDFVDHSFVLAVRAQDYNAFCTQFKEKMETDKCPRRVRGLVLEDGYYPGLGIYADTMFNRHCRDVTLSHLAMIQAAKALDWPYIFIFEDSANINTDLVSEFKNSLDNIPDDAGIIRYGMNHNPSHEVATGFYTRCTGRQYYTGEIYWCGITGSKMYCVFKTAYDEHIARHRNAFICDQAGFLFRPWISYPIYHSPWTFIRQGLHRSLARTHYSDILDSRCQSRVSTEANTFNVNVEDFLAGTNQYVYEVHNPGNCSPNKHIKTYAAEVYLGVMGAITAGDALGYSKVVVTNSSRNERYIIDSNDYARAMSIPSKDVTGISDIPGITIEKLV